MIKKLNKMNYYIQEIHKEQCDIQIVKHFYFKVKDTKLDNRSNLARQVNKVIERIKSKHNVIGNKITTQTGTIDDDFIYDRFTLKISVNCV